MVLLSGRAAVAAGVIALWSSCLVVPWAPMADYLLRPAIPVICSPAESVVVITGVSSGLGNDAAAALVEQGYTVLGTVRSAAREVVLARWPDGKPGNVTGSLVPVLCDVTDPAGVKRLKAAVASERASGKRLVAVVNNAGIGARVSLEQWLAEPSVGVEAARQFAVNYFGLLNVTQTLLPDLIEDAAEERCGSTRVINIGSLAGYVSRPADVIYSATKAAVERGTDSMRRLFKPARVWATVVEPGFVASEMCNRAECQHNRAADTTTPAIIHAVTSPMPKSRYPVASAGSFRAQTIVMMASLLPDALLDILISRAS